MTTLHRASWAAISRRRTRALLTIATIASAVAGLGVLAMPSLLGDAMRARVEHDHIYDVWVPTVDLALSPPQLATLRTTPGVRDLQTRTVFLTRMVIDARRASALIVGVNDFTDQRVDVVQRLSGTVPQGRQALVDPAAARHGRWSGHVGSSASVIDSSGLTRQLPIAGTGESLEFTTAGEGDDAVVRYVSEATARAVAGLHGSNAIDLHLDDTRPAAARATVQRLHERLDAVTGRNALTDLPFVRQHGTWPGQQAASNFETFLAIIAIVSLLSAVFLVASTMASLVAEQQREIGVMKAIGGSPLQICAVYARTAGILGAIGATIGALLAVLLANVVTRHLGSQFFGVTPSWQAPPPLIVGTIALGIAVAIAASLPSLVRAARLTTHDALGEPSGSSGRDGAIDRALRRWPLAAMTRLGFANASRRRRRSASTVAQVAIAVAIMLSFLALGRTVVDVTNHNWDLFAADISVRVDTNAKPLSPGERGAIAGIPNVARVEPLYFAEVELDRERLGAWALPAGDTLYRNRVHRGRWLSSRDSQGAAHVVVVGDSLARAHHLHVGGSIEMQTAAGPQRFQVVGIDDALNDNGRIAYLPLTTMRAVLRDPQATNGYWIQARDRTDNAVDRLSTAIEDHLASGGYSPTSTIFHVQRAENVAANQSLVTTLTVLGLLIVAISLIGLVNAIAMSVLERRREIGVLRCLGARGRDIRRAFRSEGLALTLLGWALGVPLGYLGARLLARLVMAVFKFRFNFEFPLEFVIVALIGSVALASVAMIPGLRRASRLRPVDALRYE
jgi:putative ABC transport system permease protein